MTVVDKSKAYEVIYKIDDAVMKIERLWEPKGFTKDDMLFWNKVQNELKFIAEKIARRHKKKKV